jgi:hypothetical protein
VYSQALTRLARRFNVSGLKESKTFADFCARRIFRGK